jgi:hypothetical protein
MTTNQILTLMSFTVEDLDNPITLKSITQKLTDEDKNKDFEVLSQIDASRLFFQN